MVLTPQDQALISDLINIAWQSGAVKSPQTASLLEQLRAKIQNSSEKVAPVDGDGLIAIPSRK